MEDIARLAGVNKSTVSRALSGSPLVNEETRIRVAELARSLNYSVNVGAKNLRLRQNRTIAVVVPFDPVSREELSDPFFLGLIGSLADALTLSGHDMLLSRIDASRLDLASQIVDAGRAMGVILVGQWHHHDQLNQMAAQGDPFVVWGARMADQLYATIGSDNRRGGRLAAAHLLERGARRIVFLGDPELPEVSLRHEGFVEAHAACKLEPTQELLRVVPFVPDAVRQEIEAMVAKHVAFDAIVASSGVMAMTAVSALQRLGKRVPEDVMVVGYDDIVLSAHCHPSLTTIRQPLLTAGEELVRTLVELCDGRKPKSVLLPTQLVEREYSMPRRSERARMG